MEKLFFTILLLVMAVFASEAQQITMDHFSPEEHYQEGMKALNRNEQITAMRYLLQYVHEQEGNPNSDPEKLIIANKRLGNIFLFYYDYASAYRYYEKSYKLACDKDSPLQLGILYNLGVVCSLLHKQEEAQRCDSLIRTYPTPGPSHQYYMCIEKAFYEKSFGKEQKGIDNLKQAIKEVKKADLDPRHLSTPFSELTEIYQGNGEIDSALHYARLYYNISREGEVNNMLVDSHRYLMQLYTLKKQYDSAAYHQNMYLTLSDSLMKTSVFIETTNNWNDMPHEASTQKIHGLEDTISLQKAMLWGFGMLIIMIVVVGFIIYRNQLSLRKKDREIYERNKELVDLERRHESEEKRADHDQESTNTEDVPKNDEALAGLSQRIVRLMENTEEYCNPEFSLQMLAQLLNSNTKYVSQAINDYLGQNFRGLVNEYRVKKARQRLTENPTYANFTIQAIAESVGYKSAANFIAVFKKITGLTPAHYQKMAKEDTAAKS
ncbi:MAG: AraC family transcriptional regulator [Bacteroidales bacterium]|nr:AraC family transcriptional regulator [Bacteroidales bacterium]